ncbi:hypothetical protein RRG08_018591 [Elysia crispata]|uniref:Uncharacterized protein n=1 Tax=Elysia crispata TaxID=231223 RepID=A0AAE1A6P5_9GAST|nr:hypothetical protein RRG08_018591 [Elysia crispata]
MKDTHTHNLPVSLITRRNYKSHEDELQACIQYSRCAHNSRLF